MLRKIISVTEILNNNYKNVTRGIGLIALKKKMNKFPIQQFS